MEFIGIPKQLKSISLEFWPHNGIYFRDLPEGLQFSRGQIYRNLYLLLHSIYSVLLHVMDAQIHYVYDRLALEHTQDCVCYNSTHGARLFSRTCPSCQPSSMSPSICLTALWTVALYCCVFFSHLTKGLRAPKAVWINAYNWTVEVLLFSTFLYLWLYSTYSVMANFHLSSPCERLFRYCRWSMHFAILSQSSNQLNDQ